MLRRAVGDSGDSRDRENLKFKEINKKSIYNKIKKKFFLSDFNLYFIWRITDLALIVSRQNTEKIFYDLSIYYLGPVIIWYIIANFAETLWTYKTYRNITDLQKHYKLAETLWTCRNIADLRKHCRFTETLRTCGNITILRINNGIAD